MIVECDATNCRFNNAVIGTIRGECTRNKVTLVVHDIEIGGDQHEEMYCRQYEYEDKGEAYRRGEKD